MIFNVGYLILITALLLTIFGMMVGFWGGSYAQCQAGGEQL